MATSASTEPTQFNDALHALQREHPDLELDLWGSVQINEQLRYYELVTRSGGWALKAVTGMTIGLLACCEQAVGCR